MPTAKISYDPQLRETEHGKRLYNYWKRARQNTDSDVFQSFPSFLAWAMANGYTLGARLFRRDENKPLNPENCFWAGRITTTEGAVKQEHDRQREQKWDATVNRIRVHYGMEPIHSSEV